MHTCKNDRLGLASQSLLFSFFSHVLHHDHSKWSSWSSFGWITIQFFFFAHSACCILYSCQLNFERLNFACCIGVHQLLISVKIFLASLPAGDLLVSKVLFWTEGSVRTQDVTRAFPDQLKLGFAASPASWTDHTITACYGHEKKLWSGHWE